MKAIIFLRCKVRVSSIYYVPMVIIFLLHGLEVSRFDLVVLLRDTSNLFLLS